MNDPNFNAPDRNALVPISVKPREAAKMLGVSERTLFTMTHEGGLPHFKVGRLVLYSVDALREWAIERAKGGGSDVD